MVVFVHIKVQLDRLGTGTYDFGWLSSGVDIFFVISGFIMWVSVERRSSMTPAEFMRHRIIRIVPLYWLVSCFVLAICLFAPHLLKTTILHWPHAIASFLFLPMRHPNVTDQFWPLLVPGWTLNYEMLFYVLFAIAIAGSNGSPRARLALIATLIAGTVLAANLFKGSFDAMHFYANPILFEFLAGIGVGILYMKQKVPRSWGWLVPIAAGFFLLWYSPQFGVLVAGINLIAATMIVAAALFLPAIPFPALRVVGDASYSLYLTHIITLAALGRVWAAARLQELGPLVFTLAGLALSIVVGLLCYRLFERPMTAGLKRVWAPRVRHLPVG